MRAVGLIRVSRVKGREGESFVSPIEQADRITRWCESQGATLLTIHEELDVSGGADLADRPGLTASLDDVERGDASVIVVAYFDRLFRSVRVQAEVLERVEKAGGRVFALDAGEVTGATDGEWLQAGFLGLIADYQRRQLKGRMAESQSRAIARGVATWDVRIPGYRKGPDGVLVPDELAPVVSQAFEMRRDGATVAVVREFLRGHGIERSYHGVGCLLRSRVVLGELHFGKLSNTEAHEPIVDRDLWHEVQRVIVPRGRRPTSDRLLARLGILRCGTCGSRMTVATGGHGKYWVYRCPPVGACEKKQAVSATITEDVVTRAVRAAIGGEAGSASAGERAATVAGQLEVAQRKLDAAIRAFDGLDEIAAIEKLGELRADRDRLQTEHDHLRRHSLAVTVTGADWDDLTLAERRALIVATVERVTVSPGRGAKRISLTLFEDATGGPVKDATDLGQGMGG